MELKPITDALAEKMPSVLRWGGAVAKLLRQYNVSVENKESGYATTDALTLADLSVQELVVAALRDEDPIFQTCRLEAEEVTGDMGRFSEDAPYTICLDPIDGTKQYQDRSGNGYAVMLNLRSRETVLYSLVYIPETGEHGMWVEAVGDVIRCGFDDPSRPAREVLDSMTPIDPSTRPDSPSIYMIGFQQHDPDKARQVTEAGLKGVIPSEMPGCIYELFARGEFGGSLIHTPNIYDFPVSLQIARILGGDALWAHNSEPVNFDELWNDERASMLRLPGVIACSDNPETLKTLCAVAKDWNQNRYEN
ncbi:Inositol monophosphatase family protein [Polystyrenella longa]|uniref:Inositol monophosphatase family protein n=1 Tax=Polystyrenella longa TaxID=2528007 RepID=A0A518CLR8_9PLAN|nr:inositol monophosphatase family protein [Polystyrenella longa]QDU80181.1 Inositol monophosphatase family protein [Polystyrenella longa]